MSLYSTKCKMGTPSKNQRNICFCSRPSLFKITTLLFIFSLTSLFLIKVDDIATNIASQTKTVAGHNLAHTPWHRFAPKQFDDSDRNKYSKATKMIKCSYLTCLLESDTPSIQHQPHDQQYSNSSDSSTCPSFFRWIHHDLEPWAQSKITQASLMEAQRNAAFRVVIVGGKLHVDFYYSCTQTRAMFTIWGLLQLLRRYPGMIPDVDLMFDCMDKSSIGRWKYRPKKRWPPPPLFRYCTTGAHFDIPFPDWSFWGWPETNIEPWDKEFKKIKQGSKVVDWRNKIPLAYWRGNPNVASPVRVDLLSCNNTKLWGAEIFRQDWIKEVRGGFKTCELANQCKHRYKIYAEGFAWSVSLKYIISCGSPALIISPQYEDFFSRGLMPRENYWPISRANLCRSIKFAVDWGNANPSKAEEIGKAGQRLMENLDMEKVYDYMYHLIVEYSKLQDFKPVPPSSAQQVCMDSVLCYANQREREFLENSISSPSTSMPCQLQSPDHDLIESWIQKKRKTINDVAEEMEKEKLQTQHNNNTNATNITPSSSQEIDKEKKVQAQQTDKRNATIAPSSGVLENEKKVHAQEIDKMKNSTTIAPSSSSSSEVIEKEKKVYAQVIDKRNTTIAPLSSSTQLEIENEKRVQAQEIDKRNTTIAPSSLSSQEIEKEKVHAQKIHTLRNTNIAPSSLSPQEIEMKEKVHAQEIDKSTNTTIAPSSSSLSSRSQEIDREKINVQTQQIDKRNTTIPIY